LHYQFDNRLHYSLSGIYIKKIDSPAKSPHPQSKSFDFRPLSQQIVAYILGTLDDATARVLWARSRPSAVKSFAHRSS